MKTIALLLTIPFFAFSQHNMSIDLVGGIEYSFRTLNITDDVSTSILDARDLEKGKMNWRAGFNFNKRITDKIYFKTGVRLASVGFSRGARTDLRWGSEFDGNGGWNPDPNLPHEYEVIEDFWFIEIPLAGRYEFGDEKLALFVEAGIAPSIYLTTRIAVNTDLTDEVDFARSEIEEFNKLHFTGLISFGLNYSLTPQLQIFGQPIFRYHFTSLYDDIPFKEHLYNAGLEIGIRQKL